MTQNTPSGRRSSGPRCIALVGPFQSGKTTLLEAILARMGALQRQGTVAAGSTIGDASAEARAHTMSVEANIASVDFMGETFTFIDCPGSIEFLAEMRPVLPAVDAAVVVCEADEKKVPALQLILRELEDQKIPRFLFLNKIDNSHQSVREALPLLQPASRLPLLLRQIPLWKNGVAVGYVDLALERAFIYQEHAASQVVEIPPDERDESKDARYSMLERLSDHDDALMEQLLEEVEPPRDRVFDDLAHELRDGLAVPVLMGSAANGNGMLRLMKALRHEAPCIHETAARLGITPGSEPLGYVMKTFHTAHAGKLSLTRVLSGAFQEGMTVTTSSGETGRIAGCARLLGQTTQKTTQAQAGDTVALGKVDAAHTGDMLAAGKAVPRPAEIEAPQPVMSLAVRARDRKDDVKLSAALQRLTDEDQALAMEQNAELGDTVLRGQGEMHLRVAVEKLASKFGVAVDSSQPQIGYRETIRKPVTGVRGRHKKQSGGHGQFGDVVIDVMPLPRGEGFAFIDKITGGVVPRNYIPSVEEGVKHYLKRGPLGFPVVDVGVSLTDGSYHTVDSSDMAFQTAARIGMSEAMPQCNPVLLEPVLAVEISVPSDATAKANAIVSSRRGQILGFDARDGWEGWDVVQALIPEAEITDLIIELRSATAGVGTFRSKFDHLAELSGRQADTIVASRQAAQ
ncbi:elongation factor G [Labrys neptuniae]|uniref:elongation factor G n=1 Tax=Labrys neptuniae TaxID=376174 RepID=UPI002891FD47|nr:elongation factor G [Labrys neptuniae]MDT3381953.1 elongation factor G [Labrys neptuniae]